MEDTAGTLESLFYKIDVEGLDYTLENYPDLFQALPENVRAIATEATTAMLRLTAELEAIRDEHGIEVS